METNKGYTDESRIQEYLDTPIAEGAADQFIIATQRYIDEYTERNFKADETATARLYNGCGNQVLDIDDCIEVTNVEVGDDSWGDNFTTIPNTGTDRYYVDPPNALADKFPFIRIILRGRGFIAGYANQRITAKWGFSECVPSDIQYAATVIAAGMYNFARGATGDVKTEKIGNYAVTYDTEGENSFNDLQKSIDILDGYQRIRI